MSWTFYVLNESGEPLTLQGWSLTWGDWMAGASPPDTIAAGAQVTGDCDSTLGKVAGWVSYSGARGGVTITFDVPLVFGDPSYTAACSGVYTAARMGSPTPQEGGVMFKVSAPTPIAPAPTPLAVAPAAPTAPAANTVVAPKGDGKKFTTNPNEVTTVTTTPTIGEVVGALKAGWSDLTEVGARTLASQWASETGFGVYCFNYNFGNVKGFANEPHMYLHGVRELASPAGGDAAVAKAAGLAHIATDDEIKKHRWAPPGPNKVWVVYEPPHPASRFHAYSSFVDGSAKYLARHKKYAASNAGYLAAINGGDTDQVAHILKSVGYYTETEARYKAGMKRCKATIDAKLGPVPDSPQPNSTAPPSSSP